MTSKKHVSIIIIILFKYEQKLNDSMRNYNWIIIIVTCRGDCWLDRLWSFWRRTSWSDCGYRQVGTLKNTSKTLIYYITSKKKKPKRLLFCVGISKREITNIKIWYLPRGSRGLRINSVDCCRFEDGTGKRLVGDCSLQLTHFTGGYTGLPRLRTYAQTRHERHQVEFHRQRGQKIMRLKEKSVRLLCALCLRYTVRL